MVAAGKKLPLTNNVVLDQATVLELIDQLRVSVPDEVRQARRITEEATRITERARDESDAIIARAQEQAAQMLEERELVRAAQQHAGELLEQAQNRKPTDTQNLASRVQSYLIANGIGGAWRVTRGAGRLPGTDDATGLPFCTFTLNVETRPSPVA